MSRTWVVRRTASVIDGPVATRRAPTRAPMNGSMSKRSRSAAVVPANVTAGATVRSFAMARVLGIREISTRKPPWNTRRATKNPTIRGRLPPRSSGWMRPVTGPIITPAMMRKMIEG